MYDSEQSAFLNAIFEPVSLAGLFHCLDPDTRGCCLDLVNGTGSMCLGLTRLFDIVLSFDRSLENLSLLSKYSHQENVNNIVLGRCMYNNLPLPNNSIDLVIINGIHNITRFEENGTQIELNPDLLLKEIYRVLKPGGRIFIGVENPSFKKIWLGLSTLQKTVLHKSIMSLFHNAISRDNQLSNILLSNPGGRNSNYKKKSLYDEIKSLLNRNGYQGVQLFWAWPSYDCPRVSGSMDSSSVKFYLRQLIQLESNNWKRLAYQVARILPNIAVETMMKVWSPHLLVTSSKLYKRKSYQDLALGMASEESSFLRVTQGTRTDLKTTYLKLKNDKLEKIMNISEIPSSNGSGLHLKEVQITEGLPIKPHNLRHNKLVLQYLLDLQKKTSCGVWNTQQLVNEVEHLCDVTMPYLYGNAGLIDLLLHYQTSFVSYIRSVELPIVMEHGDFTPPNIFISRGCISPIDWEYKRLLGNPMMDIGGYILSLLKRNKNNGILPKRFHKGSPIFEITRNYYKCTGITTDFAPSYYVLRLIDRVDKEKSLPMAKCLYTQQKLLLLPLSLQFYCYQTEI